MSRPQAIRAVSLTQVRILGCALVLVIAAGFGASRLTTVNADAVLAWGLLLVLAAGASTCVVIAARRQALLTPFGVFGLTVFGYFVIRPLQLLLSAGTLTHSSYNYLATPLQTVLDLNTSELTLFLDTRLTGTFDAAMDRALAAMVLCFGLVLVAYTRPLAARAATRLSRVGAKMKTRDLRGTIPVFLVIGACGQVLVLHKLGGLHAAATQIGTQGNLQVSFSDLVILNFYTVGLVMWVCWHAPESGWSWLGFVAATLELAGFYGLLGSRTLILVPILLALVAFSEVVRPLPLRVFIPAVVCAALFAAGYLAAREDTTQQRSFTQIAATIPRHALDVRAILNSSPVFDQFLEETDYIPAHSGYRYGGELGQGLAGQIPRFLDPDKPVSNDTSFRELIWGSETAGGRPVGAVGEFYRDFGFVGVAIGGLLLGFLIRAMMGLRPRYGPDAGRSLRTCLLVVGVLLLYQFLVGSYSLVFGEVLELGIPLAIALAVARSA
jgi:hypothetical protein